MNGFFAKLFELLYRSSSEMPNELYDLNVYGTVGIIMLIISVAMPCIFYFLMDKARYAGWGTWILFLVSSIILTFLAAFFLPRSTFSKEGLEFGISDYLYFAFVVCIYAKLIFIILSIIIKRFTTSLARTPF